MKRLYRFTVSILDDETFSQEEMTLAVAEALEIHTEALGIKVELEEVHDVILDQDGELAEA